MNQRRVIALLFLGSVAIILSVLWPGCSKKLDTLMCASRAS